MRASPVDRGGVASAHEETEIQAIGRKGTVAMPGHDAVDNMQDTSGWRVRERRIGGTVEQDPIQVEARPPDSVVPPPGAFRVRVVA